MANYTELKQYQIIIALLKAYGIRHCVLSAGARNVPFVHSVEQDSYFRCYSVVDERSAGYFALGLSQQIQEPVVISCTSSTATCNYYPAVAEAFYQGVPLVVLTSDRNPAMLGQWEDQMIDQVGMFDRHVKKSVNLPIINSMDDSWHCQRLVNEALLELDHHGHGPVHINIPMTNYSSSFTCKTLPDVTRIRRIDTFSSEEYWNERIRMLKDCRRILVVCGQNSFVSPKLKSQLETFFHRFNTAVCVDHMSNITCAGAINSSVFLDPRYLAPNFFKELLPQIVISFGGNVFSGIKSSLRTYAGKFEHWSIMEDGRVCDMYKSLTTIIECPPEYFFARCNDYAGASAKNDNVYHDLLQSCAEKVILPEFGWSNIYAIGEVVTRIPSGSVINMSINSAIRITNFFKLKDGVRIYANIGTYGIDGCLSSLIGQSAATESLSFMIIGDLAFFYDMNVMRIRHIGSNVRILMLNNHGGEEFYYNKLRLDDAGDLHTTARHDTKAEGWVRECGFTYLAAHDKEEFDSNIDAFMNSNSDHPVFFEVFTEMSTDSQAIYDFYDLSRPKNLYSEMLRAGQTFVKSKIGQDTATKIINLLKK